MFLLICVVIMAFAMNAAYRLKYEPWNAAPADTPVAAIGVITNIVLIVVTLLNSGVVMAIGMFFVANIAAALLSGLFQVLGKMFRNAQV